MLHFNIFIVLFCIFIREYYLLTLKCLHNKTLENGRGDFYCEGPRMAPSVGGGVTQQPRRSSSSRPPGGGSSSVPALLLFPLTPPPF